MALGSIVETGKAVALDSFDRWGRVNVPRLSAAFSFFAILSLAPSLLFAVLIGAQFLGNDRALESVMAVVRDNLGRETEPFVRDLIRGAQKPGGTLFAAIFGVVVTFYSASNLFLQFNDSIDAIWEKAPDPSFVRALVVGRLKAFLGVLGFGAALLSWVAFDSWVGWLRSRTDALPGWPVWSFVLTVLFLGLLFAGLYRSRPRGRVRFRDAVPGAVIAAIGFGASKYLLGQYFALSGVFKAYGAAGALVAILLWVFYTSQIVFFGAIVTRAMVGCKQY